MQKKSDVSMSVIRRLPRYHRFLTELKHKGVTRISSKELSEEMGLTASQIRQDFNCFGGFGQQGYGYNVPQLCQEIPNILGLGSCYKYLIIGAGNLGRAIAGHMSFEQLGFVLTGVFDNSPKVIGSTISGLTVRDYGEIQSFLERERPEMAILCVPRESVKPIADQLCRLGIRAFWNFSHYDISLDHPEAIVENVHMNDSLMTLCYRLGAEEQEGQ